jgi:putative oxygen-independent coproporphyrinogen III oxidase
MSLPTAVLPPLALYLHFPWCVSKCPYCDFNSHGLRGELPEAAYLAALYADLAAQAPRVVGRAVQSIFMGGGTPSLFSPDSLGRLLEEVRRLLGLAPDAEITLEANPATVERGIFAEYAAAGINRVSLGAQSFNEETLKRLGRIHKPADVYRSTEELHLAGLTNFNLDLMYALPEQSLPAALADVSCALALRPVHLSHYQLTLEPGTVFAAQPPPLPDEDLAYAMQCECQALLAASGFAQYEVSAYARAGRQSAHNLNYWQFGDYLGVGAGAHGKLSFVDASPATEAGATGVAGAALRVERSTHLREPRRYQASAARGPDWRRVAVSELPFEFMLNALRLQSGFQWQQFLLRTGMERSCVEPVLLQLHLDGLAAPNDGGWQTTARGLELLNDVVQRFLANRNSLVVAGS